MTHDSMMPDPRSARESRRGFSLIEVVFAMAIISIAILGIFGTMLAQVRIAEMTRQNDIASNAAKAMIDRIRATPYANIGATFGAPNNTFNVPGLPRRPNGEPHGIIHFSQPPPPEPDQRLVAQGGAFQDTPVAGNLLNVRVRVLWNRYEVGAGGPQTLNDDNTQGNIQLQTVIYTNAP